MTHPLAFTAPQPFWRPDSPDTHTAISRPQILRFASDEFIEELLATLERDPGALPAYAAQPETWREPMGAPASDPSAWLERKPSRLLPLLRRARARAGAPAVVAPKPLKLYQPAHQRHYLVAASLVCQTPGLPDRAIDAARQKVSFVVRRLFPTTPVPAGQPLPVPVPEDLSAWHEYAWVLAGKSGEWRKVGAAGSDAASARTLEAEERLAMFPASYAEASGQPRRLYIGSVPVGRRESYQGGRKPDATDGNAVEPDARLVMFQMQVLGPWKAMVATAMRNGEVGKDPDDLNALRAARLERIFPKQGDGYDSSKPDAAALRDERSRLQTASWYLLLDLMLFLRDQLPSLWTDHVLPGVRPADPVLRDFYEALNACAMPANMAGTGLTLASTGTANAVSLTDQCSGYAGNVVINLLEAVRRAHNASIDGQSFEAALEAVSGQLKLTDSGQPAGWPGFLFLFADPWFGILAPPEPPGFVPTTTDYLSERIVALIDTLADRLRPVLDATPRATDKLPEPTLASLQPADMREAWYVMRLVHERPDCEPFEGPIVSRATVPFQMAGFFDPDAPARPIRIGLPVDVSPAGLRKFDKNAVFMMSDMLCGHIDRFKGITLGDLVLSVLPWPFHKDLQVPDKGPCKQGGLELGVMCSLSIPIITICALILLMIIVALLDFIFRWLPLFVVCFPLPGFKGRKD